MKLRSVRLDILKFKYAYNAQVDSWIDYGTPYIMRMDKCKMFDKFVESPIWQKSSNILILLWRDI